MHDRRLSINIMCLVAAVSWLAGGVLIVLDTIHTGRLAAAGLFLASSGGALWLHKLVWSATHYVAGREANAFELGRDSAEVARLSHRR